MVACDKEPYFPEDYRPLRCHLDVLNLDYVNNSQQAVKYHLPWVDSFYLISNFLKNYKHPPQRILFDLPFIYYVKLVVLFSEHH